ncbi:extracellular calcium-sensing receptor-like [Acanthaster planci]|uniref:Extracellular calcium-sensing receptor-like n=1 Tax=Acanthaster planci TaxID=133434 RepID=A0A8B7Z8V6_ACAPL|nr:extracellular calcium-sensing receptor-like [Acanthaster planci]
MLPKAWLLPMANLLVTVLLSAVVISRVMTSGPPAGLSQLGGEAGGKELVSLCGLFSIHYRIAVDDASLTKGPIRERCSSYHILSYLRARAMMFAVEEINNRSVLLRNISLTYEIRDICNRKSIGLKACMNCLRLVNTNGSQTYTPVDLPHTDNPSLVFIGPDTSESAITMADFLQIFGVPLISYSATSTLLSNREKYRTFFRTIPDDGYQTVVIADIIKHYSWNWVGILAVDNSYGRSAMSDFLFHASKRGICVAFQLVVGETMGYGDMQRFSRELESFPELEVIVAFTFTKTLMPFLERTEKNSTPINALTWISTDAWTDIATRDFRIMNNVLMVTVESMEVPGFKTYLRGLNPFLQEFEDDPWLREIWEGEFGCDVGSPADGASSPCAHHTLLENEKIANAAASPTIYRVYLAVYAVAQALAGIEQCEEPLGLLANGGCPPVGRIEPWQLMKYLMAVNFTMGSNGRHVSFGKDGGIMDTFKVIQWQRCEEDIDPDCQVVDFVEIGVHKDGVLYINESRSRWYEDDTNVDLPPTGVCQSPCPPGTRKVSRDGLPACCFQCARCPEGSFTNTTGQLVCMQCPQGTWSNGNRSTCHPKTLDLLHWDEAMSVVVMCFCGLGVVSTLLMLITLTLYNNTAIVRASNREISYCLLILLIVSFLEPFLYIGMPFTWSCNFRIALHSLSNTGVLAIFVVKTRRILDVFDTTWRGFSLRSRLRRTGLQVMITVFLILLQALVVTVYLIIKPSKVLLDQDISNSRVYVQCDSNILGFIAMYTYNTILASICFVFSFRARKIPENFHETRYITVTMMFYVVIWVVSLPIYFSTNGKLQALMQIISVVLTNYLILGFMFLPKCYIIFITPERNTTQSIREQACGFRMGEINNTLVVQMDGEARRPSSRLSASDHDGHGNHS